MASETDVGAIWGGLEGLKSATLGPRCAYKRACEGKRNTLQNQAVSADALRNHPDRLSVRGGPPAQGEKKKIEGVTKKRGVFKKTSASHYFV